MPRSITLNPHFQSYYVKGATDGFRFSIVATAPVGLDDAAVFLFLADPEPPGGGDRPARFHKVCSPQDLSTCPVLAQGAARRLSLSSSFYAAPLVAPSTTRPEAEDAEVALTDPPFLRVDRVTLDFYTREEGMEAYDAIVADVRLLLKSLDYMDRMVQAAPIQVSTGG